MHTYPKYLIICLLLFSRICYSQWIQTNGANNSTVTGFAENNQGFFASYNARYDSVGVIFTNDNGVNWFNVSTGLPARQIDVLFADGSNIFAAENDAGVYRSTDNGLSWTVTGITVAYVYRFASIGTNLFAGDANSGVYLSTDNGVSWTSINKGLTNTLIRTLFANGTNLYAGTRGGGAFLSTDNGANWTSILGLNKYVYSFANIGSNLFAGTGNAGIFLSTDNGITWKAVNNGITSFYPVYSLVTSGSNLFAGTYGGGVYLSTDNGSNWTEVNEGLTFKSIQVLAVSGSYLFAGADQSGVWRRSLSELITGINKKTEYLLFKFSLSQNYPNPFNPTTTISYQLPEKSIVTLKVYDILGREIAELVNESKEAGNYKVTFDASNLSSGIYYYQIKAGNFVQSRKMLLIK